MLFYALIGSSLVLLGIAGLQFTYLFYLDRIDKERKKHISVLERKCIDLTGRLRDAEERLAEQEDLISAGYVEGIREEEWADLLEER
jgi:hypothetical protein